MKSGPRGDYSWSLLDKEKPCPAKTEGALGKEVLTAEDAGGRRGDETPNLTLTNAGSDSVIPAKAGIQALCAGTADHCILTAKYANDANGMGDHPQTARISPIRGAQIGETCPCERSATICGFLFLDRKGRTGNGQLRTANRLLATDYRFFLLPCPPPVRHNTPQTNNPDEAATNELEPFVGRTDVVRPK